MCGCSGKEKEKEIKKGGDVLADVLGGCELLCR